MNIVSKNFMASHAWKHLAASCGKLFTIGLIVGGAQLANAALVVNAPQSIVGIVNVQPIVVSEDDGSDTAEFFGDAAQQLSIEGLIDDIWAQAGLDVNWLSANTWNDSFANTGTSGPRPRPTSELPTVLNSGSAAGVASPDPSVINLYFVNAPAGFIMPDSEDVAAGFAVVDGSGIMQYVGSNLLGFAGGQETIASVVAHEIGHNLGLFHNDIVQNLMGSDAPAGSADGQLLNAAQIATVLDSALVSPVPVPASAWLFASAVLGLVAMRREVGRA